MIRSVFVGLAAFVAITAVSAQGCKASGVGDPCIPEQEFDHGFTGFDQKEVNVESKSFQCHTRLCLVNHFRGRVSCPYGQNKARPGCRRSTARPAERSVRQDKFKQTIGACLIPGGTDPTKDGIDGKDSQGNYLDPTNQATVPPQCLDREAVDTVYCSCRCANADGKTDDGANYCTCPDDVRLPAARRARRFGRRWFDGCVLHQEEHDVRSGEQLSRRVRPDAPGSLAGLLPACHQVIGDSLVLATAP